MKFRKKSVVIEAWQYDGKNGLTWPKWLHDYAHTSGEVCSIYGGKLLIPTLEGRMTADAGDWIIKGVKGELYPCKRDIFEATYERVEE